MPIETIIFCKNLTCFVAAKMLFEDLAIHVFSTDRNKLEITVFHEDAESSDYDRGFEVGAIQCLKNLIEVGMIR